jgi:hypothetical protein
MRVLGVAVDGAARAYPLDRLAGLRDRGVVTGTVGRVPAVVLPAEGGRTIQFR